jgi:POT family proton-dependent oligopeptide transporter
MIENPARVAEPPRATSWLGYPRGAWLIISVEFWERFSFYGMLAILVLFLTGTPSHGGFGWSAAKAIAVVGAYTGSMYAFPAFGGYLADRVLGRRRAVAIGASFMLVGQVLMTAPTFLPAALGAWHGVPLLDALHTVGVPLGQIFPSQTVQAALILHGDALDAHFGGAWLKEAYSAAAAGFYVALLCLIVGNALMKSTLVVLCGESFEPGDSHRESAYAYYYLGIAVGAMLSGIIVGAAAESYGWQYGFGVAAVGMAVALGLYLALAPRWLANIGARPAPRTRLPAQVPASVPRRDSAARREDLRRIRLLLVLATLLCVFSVGWFQMFGSWALFLERWVDRRVGSLVIPVPWFSSWQGLVVIVLTPFVANWLLRRAARNRQVDIVQKYVFALGTVGCGHLLMWIGALGARADSPAPLWIPIVAFGVIALGELVAWTATYGVVSRAAPAGLASMTMGAWYLLTLGLGGYLSGFSGRAVDAYGFAPTFAGAGLLAAVFAAAGMCLRAPLKRLAASAGVSI